MTNETDDTRVAGRRAAMSQQRTPVRTEAVRDEPVRDDGRRRRRKNSSSIDKFYIDPNDIPPGMSYEWKRQSVLGYNDPSYDMHMLEQGWEPVDASRHPELAPPGYKGAIVRDGMVLMERPVELTEEARSEEYASAREAIEVREQQMRETPKGTLTRDHATARPKIQRSYEPIAVPKD